MTSKRVEKALKRLLAAKEELKRARQILMLELPENVASEIHYNGVLATVPPEYRECLHALQET